MDGEAVAAELVFEAGVGDAGDGLRVGEGLVDGRLFGSGDDDFLKHGKCDAIRGFTEGGDLCVGTGFLVGEVVSGEAEYFEAAVLIGGVKLFQAFVLGCEATL